MSTYIKRSAGWMGGAALSRLENFFNDRKISVKRQWNRELLRTIGVMSIPGFGLALSACSDYLFFRELLQTSFIIGITMLLKAARHSAINISEATATRQA